MPRRHGQKLGLTEIQDARLQTQAVEDTRSFLPEGSLARQGASRQTLSSQNDRDCSNKILQTEGVSITFKYLALRPLAIIEPSKSLLRDLLPHVLKMEIHFWYKLFVHCVENNFESTIVWRSTIHVSTKSIHSHFYLGHVEHAAMNQMVGMTRCPGSSHCAAFARIIYKVIILIVIVVIIILTSRSPSWHAGKEATGKFSPRRLIDRLFHTPQPSATASGRRIWAPKRCLGV